MVRSFSTVCAFIALHGKHRSVPSVPDASHEDRASPSGVRGRVHGRSPPFGVRGLDETFAPCVTWRSLSLNSLVMSF